MAQPERKACRQAGAGRPAGRGRTGGRAGRQTELAWPACRLPAGQPLFQVKQLAARRGPARDIMAPPRSRDSPHLEPYCSASIPNAQVLAHNAANASTPGTPLGFNIDVAVLNIGMPTAQHFSAQKARRLEASGGHDTPKNKNK